MTSSAKRILFVDDESNVLDSLRVLLRKHRRTWDMEFAEGGDHALALLETREFDVVVTDLRMPRVDGLTLLKHLRDHHPQTMRIVLSGAPERSSALAVVPYAHQSLTKPCRLGELESVLARAFLLGDLVADPDVRSVIGGIGDLPSLPKTYARLVRVLDDENSSASDVAAIIAADIAVTAKVLQLANSPLFGSGRSVTSVVQAIPVLGVEALKSLTLSTAMFDGGGLSAPVRIFAEDLHEHSTLIAGLASDLSEPPFRRDAFAAGMLHDVGRLLLASTMPEEMSGGTGVVRRVAPDAGIVPVRRHARVGGYLLGLWGLPPTVIDAVARHHDPVTEVTSPIARAVAIAEAIVDEVTDDLRPSPADIEEMRALVLERAPKREAAESKEIAS
jgi:HD-like signal output (HDOD) protein/ActR/RegA family two-component response regulator